MSSTQHSQQRFVHTVAVTHKAGVTAFSRIRRRPLKFGYAAWLGFGVRCAGSGGVEAAQAQANVHHRIFRGGH